MFLESNTEGRRIKGKENQQKPQRKRSRGQRSVDDRWLLYCKTVNYWYKISYYMVQRPGHCVNKKHAIGRKNSALTEDRKEIKEVKN